MKLESLSNNGSYPKICLLATKDEEVFKNFKKHPAYTQILEHTSYEYGLGYLNVIKRDNPILLDSFIKFQTNDKYGGATKEIFEGYEISPCTLRYIKVLSDLIKLYGSLDGFKIAEIGGGYGGQCKIIKDVFNISDYNIIDMDEALGLTEKYLGKLNVDSVRFTKINELQIEEYDLVISNYAYSELNRKLQDLYKEKIIDGSKRGYMTVNFVNDGKFEYYTKQEFFKLKEKIQELNEEPLTSPNNIIISWNQE